MRKYESDRVNNSLRAIFELLKENDDITQEMVEKLINDSVKEHEY